MNQQTLVRLAGEGQHARHAQACTWTGAPTGAGPDSDEKRPTPHDVGEHSAHQMLKDAEQIDGPLERPHWPDVSLVLLHS